MKLRARLLSIVLLIAALWGQWHVPTVQAVGPPPLTYVTELERMQGMLDLYEAFNSHGSFAGPYSSPNTPIDGMTEERAEKLYDLGSLLAFKAAMTGSHVGFWLPQGDYTLLVGVNGPINRRDPFSVGPGGVWMEISGVFYDPRSDDFAIRLQNIYLERGQHPRSSDDVNKPIPGGAVYVEASWSQIQSMANNAQFKITSAVYEAYGPNKHINMDVGGRALQRHAQGVMFLDMYDALEIREPNHNPEYVPWEALVNGVPLPNTDGAGVCGLLAPGMATIFRLMLATGTGYRFEGIGHDKGHKYNPITSDRNAWQQTLGGRYFVVDSTAMDPGPDFKFWSDKPFSFTYTPLIYNKGTWEHMFYITEAHLN